MITLSCVSVIWCGSPIGWKAVAMRTCTREPLSTRKATPPSRPAAFDSWPVNTGITRPGPGRPVRPPNRNPLPSSAEMWRRVSRASVRPTWPLTSAVHQGVLRSSRSSRGRGDTSEKKRMLPPGKVPSITAMPGTSSYAAWPAITPGEAVPTQRLTPVTVRRAWAMAPAWACRELCR